MRKSLFILMLGLIALTTQLDAQIKLYNHGGIAIGDTTDPGSEQTVFADDATFNGDVDFNGTVTGIDLPEIPPVNNFDYKVYFDNDIEVNNELYVTNGTYYTRMAAESLQFSRNTSNYIQCGTAGGTLSFITNGRSTSTAQALIYLGSTATYLRYGSGTPANRLVTTSAGVTIGDGVSGDGAEILKINSERAWSFIQGSSGSSSTMNFCDRSGSKDFHIRGYNSTPVNGNVIASFFGSVGAEYFAGYYGGSEKIRTISEGVEIQGRALLQNNQFITGKNTGGSYIRVAGVGGDNNVYLGAIDNAGGKTIIREDGSDRITIVGGDVGIGDSTPSYKLDVNGTGRFTDILSLTNTGTSQLVLEGETTGSSLGAVITMKSTAAIRGRGTLYQRDDGVQEWFSGIGYNMSDKFTIGYDAIGSQAEYDTKSLMTVTTSGNVGIGDTTPSYKLDVNGTGRFTGALTASTLSLTGTLSLNNGMNVNGSSTFNHGLTVNQSLTVYGTFNNMSDENLKKDIKDLNAGSLDKITSLQGVTYKFKSDEAQNSFTGFIAQDVQKVFPELVSDQEEGLAIKTLELIPHLVEAIKEQQEILDLQLETIEAQKALIEDLQARVEKLEEK